MRLSADPSCHLTYCSNIHPGEHWNEHFRELRRSVPVIRESLATTRPFGLGLRLSASAARTLQHPSRLAEFSDWLHQHNIYLYLINGFPYGEFHQGRVKDRVYSPDWRSEKRVVYTKQLIAILTQLLPQGVEGGISTSPLSYKPWLDESATKDVFTISSRHLADLAREMALIEIEHGKRIHLDLEPEPDCLLENSEETIRFYKEWLLVEGVDHLKRKHGVSRTVAEEWLLRYVTVCYDTCHFAIAYEDPVGVFRRFSREGVTVGRLQISSALGVRWSSDPGKRSEQIERLEQFHESTYLHQVVERHRDGSLNHYRDLGPALDSLDSASGGSAEEWRVHFHVPVFMESFGHLDSTQSHILESLTPFLARDGCRLLEIETYTWDLLPDNLKRPLEESVIRELKWVEERANQILELQTGNRDKR